MGSRFQHALLAFTALLPAACGGNGDEAGIPLGPVAVRLDPVYPALTFDRPVFVTPIPGTNQLAVVSQAGTIHAFEDRDNVAPADVETFLDISARVTDGGELGLLGLAFDPNYATNGFLYVNYTTDQPAPLRTVIARFSRAAGGGVADPNSETILLEYDQPFTNHNGGMLVFGPDQLLYIASGDGGSSNDPQNNAQNRGNLLGKILRIRTTPGAIVPPNNPFVGLVGARGEIWAYGLRNPWRFTFDRATGRMWIGDVGQGAREEIDVGAAGANYGWRVYEGTLSNVNPTNIPISAFVAPVFEYGRSQGGSIAGGYVYRGSAIPALVGRYVYADFVSGRVWALTLNGATAVDNQQIATVTQPSSFGETAAGELLIVSYAVAGRLFRLVPDL
jgi:glucose/arabinose dehydrogenase